MLEQRRPHLVSRMADYDRFLDCLIAQRSWLARKTKAKSQFDHMLEDGQ